MGSVVFVVAAQFQFLACGLTTGSSFRFSLRLGFGIGLAFAFAFNTRSDFVSSCLSGNLVRLGLLFSSLGWLRRLGSSLLLDVVTESTVRSMGTSATVSKIKTYWFAISPNFTFTFTVSFTSSLLAFTAIFPVILASCDRLILTSCSCDPDSLSASMDTFLFQKDKMGFFPGLA